MPLFECSVPERQKADRILPIIPSEIYLCIFEHIAPPTSGLTPEQRRTYAHLSSVCRIFANFCLPRVFEFVVFSGAIFRHGMPTQHGMDAIYKTSRESTLCKQIAAKQPLALALAKTVRTCHFTNWKFNHRLSRDIQLFANKYIAGQISLMTNIRELGFFHSVVGAEHWDVIATLPLLEDLSFRLCRFVQVPADLKPQKKVKPSRLWVVDCTDDSGQLCAAAVDVRYLCTLATDMKSFNPDDWLLQSTLTELRLCFLQPPQLHATVMQAPQSLEVLALCVLDLPGEATDVVRSMFDSVWKRFPFLRSFTVRVLGWGLGTPTEVLSLALKGINFHSHLQSFTLEDHVITLMEISSTEVRHVLQDELNPTSGLKYVDIGGTVLRLVDGEWSENEPAERSLGDQLLHYLEYE
ncbi:hypothetical protein HD554DRAFT_1468768 [Boletus coccyginus]|nr:hypothetical protein HD554DRAFT_1468768 [Boletus coccyginus]